MSTQGGWFTVLLQVMQKLLEMFGVVKKAPPGSPLSVPPTDRDKVIATLAETYGVQIIPAEGRPNIRPPTDAELNVLVTTARDLGMEWYGPFRSKPLSIYIDKTPGGGSYGSGVLRVGDPGSDVSLLYRIFIHEGTHASIEYRQWPYETQWCTKPGFDWTKVSDNKWTHPRQQGTQMQSGDWESLPVDSRDVSTTPAEDLAEMVRYFVHTVKDERIWLWPLDQSKPATYLWATSPTRFVFVRDIFLKLPPTHPWYKKLTPEQEQLAATHLMG